MIDEVDETRIREVEVLEDHYDRRGGRQAFEEGPPGAEELLGPGPRREAEQREHRRLDPAPFLRVGHVGREGFGDLRARRRLVVRLEQAAALADHLAEGPEADPFAIGRRASVVPPDVLDQPVEVFEELPGHPGLADAGRPDHRDQACPQVARRRVEEVLQLAELVVATHERRLERLAAVTPAPLGDHAQRAPGGNRRGLALERLLTGWLEGDCTTRGPLGCLADEDRGGRGD
jgi:hypothetical protein